MKKISSILINMPIKLFSYTVTKQLNQISELIRILYTIHYKVIKVIIRRSTQNNLPFTNDVR